MLKRPKPHGLTLLITTALASLLAATIGCPSPSADAGTPDAGTPDAGTLDAGTPDAGTLDAGTLDAGTPDAGTPDAGDPAGYVAADATRGGALYDKFWTAADGVAAPTEDHPLWASRPDTTANTRTGSDTWRCKECHGWDYKGVDGAYSAGSHRTGIAGIFGTTLTPQELFDVLGDANDHAYESAGLAEGDRWDLTRFVLEALVDTDDYIVAGAFNGNATTGATEYDARCTSCHGADGLDIPPTGAADFDAWVGKIANDNPWELLHKVRFGQPGSDMPAVDGALAIDGIVDLTTFTQTLPTEPVQTDGGVADGGVADGGVADGG